MTVPHRDAGGSPLPVIDISSRNRSGHSGRNSSITHSHDSRFTAFAGTSRADNIDRHEDAADKQQVHMIDSFTVQHCEHVSQRSFEAVVAAFEAELGSVEGGDIIPREVAAATSQSDFEARIRAYEGRSGFMRFLTNDHGAWMSRMGEEAKIRSYIIGNPLIAQTMMKHDPGVGLNVPIRVQIYRAPSGEVRLAYDLPSSLMSRLHNDDVSAAALKLDAKLRALAVLATGATA
jgi:uncharacterized protein (DUF302 family)